MSIEIWGLKNCDTCKKAQKALPGSVLRDVRAEPLSASEIDALLILFGDKLVNRASSTWRGLDEAERAKPSAELLAGYPALMKRPVVKTAEATYLGWAKDTRAALGVD